MPAPSWIDGLWQRLRALLRRVFGPGRAALDAGSGLSRETGGRGALPASEEVARPTPVSATAGASPTAAVVVVAEAAMAGASTGAVARAATATATATGEAAGPEAAGVGAVRASGVGVGAVSASAGGAGAGAARGLRDGVRPVMSVRRYFGRLVSATPAGLTIDFRRWQAASVERYFLAITSPGLIRRREAPTTGAAALRVQNAFDGFEWD